MAKVKEEKEISVVNDKKRINSIMSNYKDDFLNDIEEVDYKISTGSLIFDSYINLGFGPGIVRFVGAYESGKTSAALTCMENFLENKELPFRRKAVFFRSEGRLDNELKNRCNFSFVKDTKDWEDGTCLEMLVNKFEAVFDTIKELIVGNTESIKYFIVVDSMDMLISKADSEKGFEDSMKVAGGAVITSNMLKQLALDIKVRGHFFLAISQVRADIRIQYSSAPIKDNFSGGNALLHASDWICEFHSINKGDRILEDEKEKPDGIKNPYIGHNAKVTLHKTTNRKTDTRFEFPINYSVKKGNSVWNAKEALPLLLGWECITKEGKASYVFSERLINDLKARNIEAPEKIFGQDAVLNFIEEHPPLVDIVRHRLYLMS